MLRCSDRQVQVTSPMHPSRAVREIARALPPGSVVVDEAVMLSSYVENIMEFSEPGSYFSTIACLGWGLPASLGVALATAKRPIVAIVGDGSALFGLQALWTATKYQIPIIMVILNNHSYAAVKFGFANHSYITSREPINLGCDLGDVDFPKIACAFGIDGQRIEEPTEIGPALKKAIAAGKPALFDLIVDPNDVGLGLPRLT